MLIILIFIFLIFPQTVFADFSHQFSIEDNLIEHKIEKSVLENNDQIKDLLIVEEKDKSITVLFSLETDLEEVKKYYLSCLDSDLEIELKQDNYYFKDQNYQYLFPNYDQELIFNLDNFLCLGKLAVYSKNLLSARSDLSNETTIISYQDLSF